ncbi:MULTISPECIES: GDSL-type esterase/lipase family protein [Brevundimonas]|nr:GDSL-type esterase/lipase family protein [Brevundimonas sp.]MCG2662368.1 GDSL-type esterase/lipase family protein [Brevundimonas sp.]
MRLGAVGAAVLMLGMQNGTEVPYAPMPAPAPGAPVCADGICGVEALEGVFAALAATEAGTRDRPVHILQIGDSHTAGDRITGALRARMQARFGAGGRGVLPPGVPYAGYGPMQVEVTARDWPMRTDVLARGVMPIGVGLSGGEADVRDGATMTITAESNGAFDQVQICGEAWQADGELTLTAGAETQTMGFAVREDEVWQPECQTATFDKPQTQIDIRPTGRLKLYDLRLTRRAAGVQVSNLGVVGATMQDLALRDSSIAWLELAAWMPDLIILAFGVNEGFAPNLDPREYELWLRQALMVVRSMDAPVLILGAPEGLKPGTGGPCGGRSAPEALAVVRDVQRRVAGETGVAFWDWYGRMGGDCSAERLATLPEPYMRPDRVHFTSIGAEWIGGVLSEDLIGAYDRWKAAKGEAD